MQETSEIQPFNRIKDSLWIKYNHSDEPVLYDVKVTYINPKSGIIRQTFSIYDIIVSRIRKGVYHETAGF